MQAGDDHQRDDQRQGGDNRLDEGDPAGQLQGGEIGLEQGLKSVLADGAQRQAGDGLAKLRGGNQPVARRAILQPFAHQAASAVLFVRQQVQPGPPGGHHGELHADEEGVQADEEEDDDNIE